MLFVTVTVKLVLAWKVVPRLVTLTVKVTVWVWVGNQVKTPLVSVMDALVASVLEGTEVRLKLSWPDRMFEGVTETWIWSTRFIGTFVLAMGLMTSWPCARVGSQSKNPPSRRSMGRKFASKRPRCGRSRPRSGVDCIQLFIN